MEKTSLERRGKLSALARAALAAALALLVCVPAQATTALADDAGDAVHISGPVVDDGTSTFNGGVGYRVSDGGIAYCYDYNAEGPNAAGVDYTRIEDGSHATDYLVARGYPFTTQIAGASWSEREAEIITQMAAWLVSGTVSNDRQTSQLTDGQLDAAKALAAQANAYQGGDPAIDGASSIAYCDGRPSTQCMLIGSLGGRVSLNQTPGDASITNGDTDYSLAGAVYGVYDGGTLVAQFTTDAQGHGQTGGKVKNGTYTVKEISAPAGYVLSEQEYRVTVSGHDASVDASDQPITVKIRVAKTDAETGKGAPQGGASLDGAVYRATYEQNGAPTSQDAVIKGGEAVFQGIPLGEVSVTEVQAPDGYLPDLRTHAFTVTAADAGHEEAVFELMPRDGEFSEQPVRGDLELVKVADTGMERLANVPFKITSKTTGESHVLTTDANGYASTASAWNKHTRDTNGGTAESGVWFGASEPDDSKGALLYDTYEIEEQRCDSNADRALIPAFDVTVYKDSTTINLGTLTDDEGPKIGTTATDAVDGDHEAEASSKVTLNDDVTYTGLTPGKEYKLTGTLMDKETGKPVQQDGVDVTAETTFMPTAASGVATVTFEFDASALAGHETVAFEDLTQDGAEVAVHTDIDDEGQTVRIVPPEPKVGTTATDADDGDHEATADDSVTINDEVSYENLVPGKKYTLTGTLMDKSTGKPVQSGGKDVTSTVSFAPEQSSGTQTVTFTFDGAGLGGHETVAFESLQKDGTEVAAHADISDEGQTVKLVPPEPQIGTTATDADDGDHEAVADDSVTINDEVSYEGLTPGKEYTLTGTLMDKSIGKPIQSDGKDVTSTVAFTPETADGTQTVTFTFDGADLGGHETVAFELLQKDGIEVAAHADIDDESQTVKLTPPEETTPQSGTPSTGMPRTGECIPWISVVCFIAAAGCAAGVMLTPWRHSRYGGTDTSEDDEGDE